jgi:hypothetical protein
MLTKTLDWQGWSFMAKPIYRNSAQRNGRLERTTANAGWRINFSTGEGALSPRVLLTVSAEESAPALRPASFSPSLYGEKCPAGQ